MSKMGIYEIRNTKNNKMYIGSSKNIEVRWKQHKSLLRSGKHHSQHLQYAWDKYGQGSFEFSELEPVPIQGDLFKVEQLWMDKFKSYNPKYGYNISTVAGSCIMNEKYNFEDIIQEEIERENMFKIIYAITNKENGDLIYQYPHLVDIIQNDFNGLAHKIYTYLHSIEFNTYCQISLYASDIHILLNDFYGIPLQAVSKLIKTCDIKMIHFYDPQFGQEASIYSDNFHDHKMIINRDGDADILYDDGFKTNKYTIVKERLSK